MEAGLSLGDNVRMLRDLGRADWLELLALPEDRIPRVLLLRGTRNLDRHYRRYRERFDDVLDVGTPNGLLEHVLIGSLEGHAVAYASVYGAAMASEVAHLFSVLGTELLLQTGCCGAWVEGIEPGDLFVPTRAACGEGAAQYYAAHASVPASYKLAVEAPEGLRVFGGRIYTTAALFAEGRRDVESWAAAGWDAVDMETATTFAVAAHFGVRAASLLFAFDNPLTSEHIVEGGTSTDARRARGDQAMVEASFAIISAHLRATTAR